MINNNKIWYNNFMKWEGNDNKWDIFKQNNMSWIILILII